MKTRQMFFGRCPALSTEELAPGHYLDRSEAEVTSDMLFCEVRCLLVFRYVARGSDAARKRWLVARQYLRGQLRGEEPEICEAFDKEYIERVSMLTSQTMPADDPFAEELTKRVDVDVRRIMGVG